VSLSLHNIKRVQKTYATNNYSTSADFHKTLLVFVRAGYGLEIDMWALGVILYILLCGFPPFRSPDRKQSELFQVIKEGYFEFLSPYWDGNSKSEHAAIFLVLLLYGIYVISIILL